MNDNYFHVFLTKVFEKHHKTIQVEADAIAKSHGMDKALIHYHDELPEMKVQNEELPSIVDALREMKHEYEFPYKPKRRNKSDRRRQPLFQRKGKRYG